MCTLGQANDWKNQKGCCDSERASKAGGTAREAHNTDSFHCRMATNLNSLIPIAGQRRKPLAPYRNNSIRRCEMQWKKLKNYLKNHQS